MTAKPDWRQIFRQQFSNAFEDPFLLPHCHSHSILGLIPALALHAPNQSLESIADSQRC